MDVPDPFDAAAAALPFHAIGPAVGGDGGAQLRALADRNDALAG